MKGIFIPEITVEMFRSGCLESIETLMAEGEVYDIEYGPKSEEPERKKGEWIVTSEFEDCRYVKCNQCKVTQVFYYGKPLTNFCSNCGADMRTKEASCDYERAVEQLEHDILYEPTFNQNDGSM